MEKIVIIILASCFSSLVYRAGGMSKELSAEPKWIPMFMRKSLYRDCGCSLVACLLAGYLLAWHWTLILCFGLMWGALSTYNKWFQVFVENIINVFRKK